MKQRILSVCACVFVGLCVSALSASDKFYTRYVHACYPELRISLSVCLSLLPTATDMPKLLAGNNKYSILTLAEQSAQSSTDSPSQKQFNWIELKGTGNAKGLLRMLETFSKWYVLAVSVYFIQHLLPYCLIV